MRFAKLGMVLLSGAMVFAGIGCLPSFCDPTGLLVCEAEGALKGVADGVLGTASDTILGFVPEAVPAEVTDLLGTCLDQAAAQLDIMIENQIPGVCVVE